MKPVTNQCNAETYPWGLGGNAFVLHQGQTLVVKLETLAPRAGETLHLHQHAEQVFFVLSGYARFWVEDKNFILSPQDCISVFPGQKHQIENQGETVLEFLVISAPNTNNDRINCASTS